MRLVVKILRKKAAFTVFRATQMYYFTRLKYTVIVTKCAQHVLTIEICKFRTLGDCDLNRISCFINYVLRTKLIDA